MPLTPPRRRDYALTPSIGVASVATMTILFGSRLLRPPLYLGSWFEFGVLIATFLTVVAACYRWRAWRRERDPAAYSVRSASAWSLEEDWRHQLRLWGLGLAIGAVILAGLRLMYGLGWLGPAVSK